MIAVTELSETEYKITVLDILQEIVNRKKNETGKKDYWNWLMKFEREQPRNSRNIFIIKIENSVDRSNSKLYLAEERKIDLQNRSKRVTHM